MQDEARKQREWAEACHDAWLAGTGSELAGLQLGGSLQQSMWAMAMVRACMP
jgi:hypothetical protein